MKTRISRNNTLEDFNCSYKNVGQRSLHKQTFIVYDGSDFSFCCLFADALMFLVESNFA